MEAIVDRANVTKTLAILLGWRTRRDGECRQVFIGQMDEAKFTIGEATPTTNNDDRCNIGVAPAATLLLCYRSESSTARRWR